MKTVNISGWVAKPAWDKTVGGVRCTQSLQTGSQLGPNLAVEGWTEKLKSRVTPEHRLANHCHGSVRLLGDLVL